MTNQTKFYLKSDCLTVEIAQPGRVYAGTRFDWSAFITQVTLTDVAGAAHTFCVPESLEVGQGTGGIGLCNEFGIEEAIGYDEAQPGDCFPKLGIGLLVKPEPPPAEDDGRRRGPRRAGYNFFLPHEIAAKFPLHIEAGERQATFTFEPVACRGYAARLTKTVSVKDAELTLAYSLENVGEKPITTTEYVHNFMGIDGHLMGPDYRLRLPTPIEFAPPPPGPFAERMAQMMAILDVQGGDLRCRATPDHPFYCRPLGFAQTDAAQWELVHEPSGVGMREYDDFAPDRVAVWGTTHVISAEVFVPLHVLPGKTQRWTRRYEFFTQPE